MRPIFIEFRDDAFGFVIQNVTLFLTNYFLDKDTKDS